MNHRCCRKKINLLLLALACGLVLAGCKPAAKPATPTAKPVAQAKPVTVNPINNVSTKPGLVISDIEVEGNTDPATGKNLKDHLQLTINNGTIETMTGFEVFYTMTDKKTKKSESYYQKLTGFQLGPGRAATLHFDGGKGPGHYPENNKSIYRKSRNAVDFMVEVSCVGFQPAPGKATKTASSMDGL